MFLLNYITVVSGADKCQRPWAKNLLWEMYMVLWVFISIR